jgi:hypothetical protein
MRLGAAVARDERDDLSRVERGGVGGREVDGDENVGVAGVRQAGCRDAAEGRHEAGAHVVDVLSALPHIAAEGRELFGDGRSRLPDGAFGAATVVEQLLRGLGERGVGGHERRRLEHVACVTRDGGGAGRELGLDGGRGIRDASVFVVDAATRRGLLGRIGGLDGRGHAGDRTDDAAGADPHTRDLGA